MIRIEQILCFSKIKVTTIPYGLKFVSDWYLGDLKSVFLMTGLSFLEA